MKILFVGDIDDSVAHVAKQKFGNAFLLDHSNYQQWLISADNMVCYTSLGDLPNDEQLILNILYQADEIHYTPPSQWSDGNKHRTKIDVFLDNSIQQYTERLLLRVDADNNNVTGLDYQRFNNLEEYLGNKKPRITVDPQIWIVGDCKIKGAGVYSYQKLGYHVEQYTNMKSTYLYRYASSIQWHADQILRSDIQENDLVIWGLSHEERLTYLTRDKNILDLQFNDDRKLDRISRFERSSNDLGISCDTIEKIKLQDFSCMLSVKSILQVDNFCKKIGAKLLILSLSPTVDFDLFFTHMSNYVCYNDKEHSKFDWVDLSRDGLHPGPEQHKLYGEFVIKKLKQLKYIQ